MKLLKNLILLLLCFSFTNCVHGQIEKRPIEKNELPAGLLYDGDIKTAFRWLDLDGEHITLITETGESPSENVEYEGYRDAKIFAYDFLVNGTKVERSWRVYDFVRDCPVDIRAHFVNNTFQITDLDGDGKGEVWLMYKVACYGDVSPLTMKIIMYEGSEKFAMRGSSKVKFSNTESEGGEYKLDKAFLNGPKEFQRFAEALWESEITEAWD